MRPCPLPVLLRRYASGAQHTLPAARPGRGYERGETATLLAWLQNEAGRARYPVTYEVVRRQVEAWDVQ